MTRVRTLYGIGVGPGDPELITVKGLRILREVPVVAYPKTRMGKPSYAYGIVERYLDPQRQELLGLVFPMTRDRAVLEAQWEAVVAQVWRVLAEGKDVAFVTEGDPYFYSTFIHLSRLMKRRHPEVEVIVVPGVTSVNGAAARLDLPLADGDERIVVVPATEDLTAMGQLLDAFDCVVFLKVAKVLDAILGLLRERDLLDKAAVITRATAPGAERIVTDVAALEGEELEYLSLMVVRK